MRTSCDIVRDLLPLFMDSTISNDGKQMVREHLKSCSNCSSYLADMRNENVSFKAKASTKVHRAGHILSDTLHYKAIANRYRKKKAVVSAIMTSAGVICVGAVIYSFARLSPENIL